MREKSFERSSRLAKATQCATADSGAVAAEAFTAPWGADADHNRYAPQNTPYADWWAGLSDDERAAGS